MLSANKVNEESCVENVVETSTAKCRNCGANMVFEASTQSLYCSHCENRIKFNDQTAGKELDFSTRYMYDESNLLKNSVVFICDNCNAKIVLDKNQTATVCPFCATSHVHLTEDLQGVKPNAIVPFNISDEKAVGYAKGWAKRRVFAPRKFKKSLCAKNVKGVYYPCFTFDSYTSSVYSGRIGKTHTRTVGSGKNRRTQTYTVWRNISGNYFSRFDDVLVSGGQKIDQKTLNKISPFYTNESKEYQENYLLGFMAYHYDDKIESCWDTAKSFIDVSLRSQILSQYSYDKVSYLNVSTKHQNVTFKYVMLPVYVGSFNYKTQLYNFFVNGRTGKVTGKSPISALKIFLTILGGIGLITLFYLLFFR